MSCVASCEGQKEAFGTCQSQRFTVPGAELGFIAIEGEFTGWLPKLKETGFAVMVGGPGVPVPVRFNEGDENSVLPLPSSTRAVRGLLATPTPVGLKRK